jgi:hypothetical protein
MAANSKSKKNNSGHHKLKKSLCKGKIYRIAPARVSRAEQPWGFGRRDGLPARLGAHWEVGQ